MEWMIKWECLSRALSRCNEDNQKLKDIEGLEKLRKYLTSTCPKPRHVSRTKKNMKCLCSINRARWKLIFCARVCKPSGEHLVILIIDFLITLFTSVLQRCFHQSYWRRLQGAVCGVGRREERKHPASCVSQVTT